MKAPSSATVLPRHPIRTSFPSSIAFNRPLTTIRSGYSKSVVSFLAILIILHVSPCPPQHSEPVHASSSLQLPATECSGILCLADLAQLIRVHPLGRKDLIVTSREIRSTFLCLGASSLAEWRAEFPTTGSG